MTGQHLVGQQLDDLKLIYRALLKPIEVRKLMLRAAVPHKQYLHAQLGHAKP